jgi:hypothetical protein
VGSVAVEPYHNERGERTVWLEEVWLSKPPSSISIAGRSAASAKVEADNFCRFAIRGIVELQDRAAGGFKEAIMGVQPPHLRPDSSARRHGPFGLPHRK